MNEQPYIDPGQQRLFNYHDPVDNARVFWDQLGPILEKEEEVMRVEIVFIQVPDDNSGKYERNTAVYENVKSTIGEGDYFTITLEDNTQVSFPDSNIFAIVETDSEQSKAVVPGNKSFHESSVL